MNVSSGFEWFYVVCIHTRVRNLFWKMSVLFDSLVDRSIHHTTILCVSGTCCWEKIWMSEMTMLIRYSKVYSITFTRQTTMCRYFSFWTSTSMRSIHRSIFDGILGRDVIYCHLEKKKKMLCRTMAGINGVSLSPLIVMQFVFCWRARTVVNVVASHKIPISQMILLSDCISLLRSPINPYNVFMDLIFE